MSNQFAESIHVSEYRTDEIIEVQEMLEHEFTDEEITQMKEEYFELSEYKLKRESLTGKIKSLMQMDASPEHIKTVLNGLDLDSLGEQGTKSLDNSMDSIRYKIGEGWEYRKKRCLGVPHRDIDTMAIYSEDGIFIKSRPMTFDEKQYKLRLA